MSLNFCVCCRCCCCCFRFRFRFSHFACPSGLVSFLRLRRRQRQQQWLAYVFCCSMDLLSRFHCHPRVVFNIICLSTCCGICSRQHSATAGHEGDGGGGGGRTTRTRRPTLALALRFWLRVFFLYFFLSFVLSSCHFFHVCVSAYNVSPSFCCCCRHLFCLSAASRLSLVMFSYIFVHCLPLI